MTTSSVARVRLVKRPSSPPAARTRENRDARPFVKWVGGKGRLLAQLKPLLPVGVHRMRHVEPFIGGGAMFFDRRPERSLLCDVNPSLIGTYRAIRDSVDDVVEVLEGLAAGHSKEAYYGVRTHYNSLGTHTGVERAGMFIYLNKTCFNGLHRVNRKGEFNVPAGRYKNPRICDHEGLRAASRALADTELRCDGFESLVATANPGDFVYFDPPYEPVSDTANFTAYTTGGFDRSDQTRLRDLFRALDRRGCKLMLSNSDVPFIRDLYDGFRIDVIAASRAINCNARKRGKVAEVVVRNY